MFFTQTFRHDRNNNPKFNNEEGQFFVLTSDDWNDYGYETTFWLGFWKDKIYTDIGLLRILHTNNEITRNVIPEQFDSLSEEYISLGYDEKFYRNLIKAIGKKKALKVLTKLNDITLGSLENNISFKLDDPGIQSSLFRSTEGRYLYSEVKNKLFFKKDSLERNYRFTFLAELYLNNNDFKEIEIDFSKSDNYLPNRMFTIVGKNGVGKTRLLNQLAESLFDSSKPENKNRFKNILKDNTDIIDDNIPIYNKVIAISFSVFDKFYKGDLDDHNTPLKQESDEELTKFNNYTYIGLHKVDNSIYTNDELIEINKRAYKKIIESNREKLFVDSINSSNLLYYKLDYNFNQEEFFTEIFSSGQNIFVSMLCRLLSEIEDNSLIFLDEPELYLHPNAIANLANIYYNILDRFKSYAILCTHSPILVQEIPSKYVRKMFITDNDTIHYARPNIETFGANVSELTADIFNVLDSESLYRSKIIDWIKNHNLSEKEILNLFNNNLSLKTQLFIASIFKEVK